MTKHYGLTEKDVSYLRIKEACFRNFMSVKSKNILEVLEIASILWLIYGTLAGHRLLNACDKENLMSYQNGKHGRLNDLKAFLISCRGRRIFK
jgi:hypothetical protein